MVLIFLLKNLQIYAYMYMELWFLQQMWTSVFVDLVKFSQIPMFQTLEESAT